MKLDSHSWWLKIQKKTPGKYLQTSTDTKYITSSKIKYGTSIKQIPKHSRSSSVLCFLNLVNAIPPHFWCKKISRQTTREKSQKEETTKPSGAATGGFCPTPSSMRHHEKHGRHSVSHLYERFMWNTWRSGEFLIYKLFWSPKKGPRLKNDTDMKFPWKSKLQLDWCFQHFFGETMCEMLGFWGPP